MRWAINHRSQHVRADAPGVYSWLELNCPVCKQRVFPRRGPVREAHFAHYGGNSSKACELYQPGEGEATSSSTVTQGATHTHKKKAFGAPALLWRSEQSFPASLYLRLPSNPGGFDSSVKIISRATSQFRGADLARPMFAGLRLQVPPAELETVPADLALEALIKETLSHFKFTGNYFRATNEGGVLLASGDPLELGEDYWLVSQTPLRQPVPHHLRIDERRSDRAWFAYRIALSLVEEDVVEVMAELTSYLQRKVIRPTPKVDLVWPTPSRIDLDGVPVFDFSVSEILVRSSFAVPQCLLQTAQLVSAEPISNGFFTFRFDGGANEALIGTPQGPGRRLRFASCDLARPTGVVLHIGDESVQAFDPKAGELIAKASDVRVEVPSPRLWRNVRVNGVALRPLPDGNEYAINGQLHALSAGAFGEVFKFSEVDGVAPEAPWYSSIERIVALVVGPRAAIRLRHVQSKGQLIRWVSDHDAHALLPKLLSILSAEVTRGVP
jgi:hypothetical protein